MEPNSPCAPRHLRSLAAVSLIAFACSAVIPAGPREDAHSAAKARLRAELKRYPHRIVYETYRRGDWELSAMNADGSNAVNLTNNPKAHELYPHASADGRRICFVADEGEGKSKVRSVYCMNADGTGRTLVARNARQPCWSPDGRTIAYARGEYDRFTHNSYGTRDLFFYDTKARRHRQHANPSVLHLCYLCWSPDAKWVFGTVHGGMGYGHANLAIEADGSRLFRLERIQGCRPDIRADGRKILWNATDQTIVAADLDLTSAPPKIANVRVAVTCGKTHKMYHGDWSPDGRYILFSHGPKGSQHVGQMARGWHICVADATATDVWIPLTTDGVSNKEPDWLPAGSENAQ